MKIQIKLILIAILVAFGRLFAAFALAAQGKVGKSIGFNFLPALCVILLFSVLTACGGGGSGGGGGPAAVTPAPTPPSTMTVAMLGTGPYYYLTYDNISVPRTRDTNFSIGQITVTISAGQRWLRRYDGASIALSGAVTMITPGGSPDVTTTVGRRGIFGHIETVSSHVIHTRNIPIVNPANQMATLEQTVYMADFGHDVLCTSVRVNTFTDGRDEHHNGFDRARAVTLECLNSRYSPRTVIVHRQQQQILPVCWRDMNSRRSMFNFQGSFNCIKILRNGIEYQVALAFPDQTYRRDDGKCQSAPFYAVGNCQSENAVDVGNFAAFVSGLDGNGYRQFGIRHRWESDEWNAMAMVSHAKGLEFLDTWWGRLRLEHSILDDATAFAEYESGITSLRQNGFMFADIPIAGGRVGFRFKDWTASFGRPMHYKGKGNNAAAIHWKFDKESELSFRTHNNNTELQWQWRRRF